VAHLLGLGLDAVDAALAVAASPSGEDREPPSVFRLRRGDVVVVTGQTNEPRDMLEKRALAAGLNVAGYVTRKTRLLVAADPDSLSTKARKARDHGIPIVTEEGFARLVTDLTGQHG
jgi:DNA polymerase-3 subunit epsilon